MNTLTRTITVLTLPLACTTGCLVPAKQYEAAVANANAQHQALVTLQTELEQCEERRANTLEKLAAAEAETSMIANSRSGLELDLTVARRERDDAQVLVEQLRGEFDRVGRDVRTFAGRNAELQESLEQLETRVEDLAAAERAAEERTKLFSELALGLRKDLARGVVDLELVAGRPVVLLLPPAANAGGLSDQGKATARLVGRVIADSPGGRVEVRVSPPAARVLGDAVVQQLHEGGLEARRATVRGPMGRKGSPLIQLIVELEPAKRTERPR